MYRYRGPRPSCRRVVGLCHVIERWRYGKSRDPGACRIGHIPAVITQDLTSDLARERNSLIALGKA